MFFTLYTSPLGQIARQHNLQAHFYVGVTFHPNCTGNDDIIHSLTNCLCDFQTWMQDNFLKLNTHKTKLITISSPHFQHKISIPHIQIGDVQVTPSTDVRNLSVIFDQCMTLEKHVCRVCQTFYMHLRRIGKIRHLLSKQVAEQLIHAFITSRLDFCNSLLTDLPQSTLNRLQSV